MLKLGAWAIFYSFRLPAEFWFYYYNPLSDNLSWRMLETQRQSQTPLDTLLTEKVKNQFIQTPNSHINSFMGGGLYHGMITQLYGQSGSGKTQISMLYALGAMERNLTVGYLATSKELHFGRFTELAYSYMNEDEYEERENFLMYKKTTDFMVGMQFIDEIMNQIKVTGRGGLLIIDSVYGLMNACFQHFNIEHDNLEKSRRQAEFVNRLRWMAKVSRVSVLLINQASDNVEGRRSFSMGGNLIPALGPSWDLNMDESLQVSKKGQIREMKIMNSPKSKVGEKFRFRINTQGFTAISEDGVEYD